MSFFVDFHIHSSYSDGAYSCGEIEEICLENNVKYISITDHDDIQSSDYKFKKIKNINGIELSTFYGESEIHLLGYGYKSRNKKLLKISRKIQKERVERFERMLFKAKKINLLSNKNYKKKYNLNYKKDQLGRNKMAEILIKERACRNKQHAYNKYLGENKMLYEPVKQYNVFEGFQLLKNECKIVALAHPQITKKDEIIKELAERGMNGIEVYYPFHDAVIIDFYLNLTEKYNILPVGGSDFHKGEYNFKLKNEKVSDFLNRFNLF
ncbi:MAG: hypothetical protein FXF47_01075 [Candidatus Mcinerneyibacterium aminivorans]|uniref:Polymerase/histidinol phosphatase N-terminal domain-containing protein n=1 Tax=Candidatus Mcinerneyibacterium aminivorans TaxID=2703815 RepID=A0A5D0MN64_9BACT|nr:MAG: hypothetical protein FXF47_01075 [Candidatus Mcinerneyibacterium aminivorans]